MAASESEKHDPLLNQHHLHNNHHCDNRSTCYQQCTHFSPSIQETYYSSLGQLPPSNPHRWFTSGWTKLVLVMVAIPAYFLATTAYSSLVSILHHPTSVPQPPDVNSRSTSLPSPATVLGPLIQQNFPDPAIIHVDGISYAFATNNRGVGGSMIHVQVATSRDNITWTVSEKDALPLLGAWETGNRVWAPDVVQLADGTFVLYYSDDIKTSPAHHCVGAATSKSVMGPYSPQEKPFACPDPDTIGGAIDPDGFLDPSTGRRYVVYKVDGNSLGHGGSCMNGIAPLMPTPLMLQEVAADGLKHIGKPVQILDRDTNDGPLIEAPSLFRSIEGIYFLFFSSNCFTGPLYDTSYATATNITGPYTKTARPLFITGDKPDLVGPGGMDISRDGELIVFHSHIPRRKIGEGAGREHITPQNDLIRGMYSAKVAFKGHRVILV